MTWALPHGNKEIEILSLLISEIERDRENVSLAHSPISLSIPCLLTSNSFYLFFKPNSRLFLSIPFYLYQSIFFISTYTCFYPLATHL